MLTKTYLKKMLASFCLLLTVHCTLFAQTGNPLWSLPPKYFTTPPPTLTSLPSGSASNQYTHLDNPFNASPAAYQNYAFKNGDTVGPHNMMADKSGNPLFFVTNGFMYNAHGFLIDSLVDTLMSIGGIGGSWYNDTINKKMGEQMAMGWSDICIVPKPGNCKQYYVFTSADYSNSYYLNYGGGQAGVGTNGYKPFFALIDMSGQTPYGAPTGELGKNITNTLTYIPTGGSTPKPLPGGGHIADLYMSTNTTSSGATSKPFAYGNVQYACTRLISGSYRFLFVTTDLEIIVYKIDASGINFLYNYSLKALPTPASSKFNASNLGAGFGELECYVDSVNNLVNVAIGGQGEALAIANFWMSGTSPAAGSLAGFGNVIFYSGSVPSYISGLEYSPDGNTLYIMSDIGLGNVTSSSMYLNNLSPSGFNAADFTHSQMELGKDGSGYSIYLIGQNGSSTPRMAKITNPNNPGSIGFTDNVLSLPNYTSTIKQMYCPYYGGVVTQSTTFYMPDQIDQEVYGGNFNANTSCCLFYSPYDKFTYSAINTFTGGTNQTWSANTSGSVNNPVALASNLTSTVIIGEELRIPAGYTVTINNMTLKFSPQARLIIENGNTSGNKHGGQLVLNGCTLTVDNRCNSAEMWPGVQVWGTPASTHGVLYQGYLALNSSVIENAYVGVLAGFDTTNWYSPITPRPAPIYISPTHYPFTVSGATHNGGGGFVYATSSTFLNNMKAMVFNDYSQNSSPGNYATLCNFSVNAALLTSGVNPGSFVTMYSGINHLTINGSTFYDSHNLYSDTGIFSVNSTYTVDVSGSTRSKFTSLKYGIYSYNSSGSAFVTCKNSTLNDNVFGIYLGLVNNAVIANDTFRIHQYTCHGLCTPLPSYGLYTDNCTGYDVQDNYLTKYGTSVSSNCFGIIVNNSGAHANAIFRNTFNNIYTGSQAQFVNYAPAGGNNNTGLLYQCNIFSGSLPRADIYVPDNVGSNYGTISCPTCARSGIQSYQGSGGSTVWPPNADNQFSHSGGSAYDFYIDSTSAAWSSTYFYYCTSGCGTSTFHPLKTKNIVVGIPITTTTVSCSSTNPYSNGYRTSNPVTSLLDQADSYKQTYDSLNALIDGGSTAGLLLLVSGTNNSQAVFNSLSQATPYLSNEVLKAYINSNYPANDITQVLTACSPLSNEVNTALTASNLSSGIKSQIAALQTGASVINSLGSLTGAVLSSRHMLFDKAIHMLLENDDSVSTQQAHDIMRLRANELPHRTRLENALELGDTAIAQQELTAVSNLEGNTNYVALYNILVSNIGKAPEQFVQDQAVQSQLLAMTNDSSDRHAYLKAHVLLRSVGINKYVPYVQQSNTITDNNNNVRIAATQPETIQIQSESTLYNQPNPFKESTIIQTHIVEKTQNAYLVITDMLGAEVARYAVQQGDNTINVSAANLQQSVMFCTLVVDGVKIKTNKMVLIK